MDKTSSGKNVRALISALMSIVLAVGLMPLPALANTTAGSSPALRASSVVTDPTDIKTDHPYMDNEHLEWTYTYDGKEDMAGFMIKFADDCVTEADYDVLTIKDGAANVIAELSGDFGGKEIYAPNTRSLVFVFVSDADGTEYGFEVASIAPITGVDAAIARMTEDEKEMLFAESNLIIDGVSASEYVPAIYSSAEEDERQRKPEVILSNGDITLTEGVHYQVNFFIGGRRVSNPSDPGVYTFFIDGSGVFQGHSVKRYDSEAEENKTAYFEFTVKANSEKLAALVNSTEILPVEGIDEAYPDPYDKATTVRKFTSIARAIEASLATLGGDAEDAIGHELYIKALSIIDAASMFIDLNALELALLLTEQSGIEVEFYYHPNSENEIGYSVYALTDPINPDPILKVLDAETGEYVVLPDSAVNLTYFDSELNYIDELPTSIGFYGVRFTGVGRYCGCLSVDECIFLTYNNVYAYLDGDTLVITAHEPNVAGFYSSADEADWDEDLSRGIGKWYGERDRIKHLRFDGKVILSYDLAYLLYGLEALESADFTGLATDDGTYNDNELFSSLSEAFTQVTFSKGYVPSGQSGLTGGFLNPYHDASDPDSPVSFSIGDLASNLDEATYGPWVRDSADGPWRLANGPIRTDVEAPTAREGLVYDGAEKVAVEPGELYDVEGGSATGAGDYAATVTLKDPKRYQWPNGSTEPLNIEWSIAKATVTEPIVTSVFAYDSAEKTAIGSNDLYSVEGGSATDAGSYTATVTLKDSKNYKWSDGTSDAKTYEWSIVEPVSAEIPSAPAGLIFDGSEKVAFADTDLYTVEGGSAVNAGTYTATLSLKDTVRTRWSDGGAEPRTVEWSIAKLDISKATVALGTKSYTYDGKAKEPQVASVKVGGLAVAPGNYDVTYAANVDAGNATVTVKGKANCTGSAKTSFTIAAKQTTPSVTLSKTSLAYNGKAQAPSVTVRVGGAKLSAKAYSVTLPKGRKNVGTYNVKVTLSGNYKGTKTVAYKIVPKATSVSKLAPGSKSLTVKWAKQTAQADGYEILLATNAKFTSGKKTVTVKGAKNASKAVKGLKGNTKYYVKVRTYKAVGKTKYYSAWSAAKSAKTKK